MPTVAGSWASPSARATGAATTSTPHSPDRAARRAGVDGRPSPLSWSRVSTRAPWARTAARWSATSMPEVSGHLGPQVRDLHDPGRRGGDRVAQAGHAQHRQHAGVQRPGGVDHLVGGDDGGDRVGGGGDVGGHQLDPADAPAVRHRDLALHRLADDVGPAPSSAFSTTGSTVAGTTRPTAFEQAAGLVERVGEARRASRSARPGRGCRGRGPRARRRGSGARTPPTTRRRRRRARPGTGGCRPAAGRRGRGGAGPTTRRRRPRSRPR